MSYFAKVNNNIVEKVIAAEQSFFETYIDNSPGEWIQTSYNTRGGIHYQPNSNIPSVDQSKALRKNYAGIGYTYDRQKDAFIPPKLYNSWTLNETTCLWEPPVLPTGELKDNQYYFWNESIINWEIKNY